MDNYFLSYTLKTVENVYRKVLYNVLPQIDVSRRVSHGSEEK